MKRFLCISPKRTPALGEAGNALFQSKLDTGKAERRLTARTVGQLRKMAMDEIILNFFDLFWIVFRGLFGVIGGAIIGFSAIDYAKALWHRNELRELREENRRLKMQLEMYKKQYD